VTAPDAPGLRELGIDCSDGALMDAARAEPAIVAEEAEHQGAKKPQRRRAGPLVGEERKAVVDEATSSLRRGLFCLLLATEDLSEVHRALAAVHLELRRYPPDLDALAGWIQRSL
jgi:hypothetical protein